MRSNHSRGYQRYNNSNRGHNGRHDNRRLPSHRRDIWCGNCGNNGWPRNNNNNTAPQSQRGYNYRGLSSDTMNSVDASNRKNKVQSHLSGHEHVDNIPPAAFVRRVRPEDEDRAVEHSMNCMLEYWQKNYKNIVQESSNDGSESDSEDIYKHDTCKGAKQSSAPTNLPADLKQYIKSLRTCYLLPLGFDAEINGAGTKGAKLSRCPCCKSNATWRNEYKLDDIITADVRCDNFKVSTPKGLIDHLRDKGGTSDRMRCKFHYAARMYLESLYAFNFIGGDWQEGANIANVNMMRAQEQGQAGNVQSDRTSRSGGMDALCGMILEGQRESIGGGSVVDESNYNNYEKNIELQDEANELEKLKIDYQALIEESEEQHKNLQKERENNENAQGRAASLEKELGKAKEENDALWKKIALLQSDKETSDEHWKRLNKDMSEKKHNSDRKVSELSASLQLAQANLSKATNDANSLKMDAIKKQEHIDKFTGSLDAANSRIESLQAQHITFLDDLSAVRSELSQLVVTKEELVKTNTVLLSTNETLNSELSDSVNRGNAMDGNVKEMENTINKLQQRIATVTSEKYATEEILKSLEVEKDSLVQNLGEMTKECDLKAVEIQALLKRSWEKARNLCNAADNNVEQPNPKEHSSASETGGDSIDNSNGSPGGASQTTQSTKLMSSTGGASIGSARGGGVVGLVLTGTRELHGRLIAQCRYHMLTQ
ncbi:hypothetical protein ACHAWO_007760 [Cyclotella atomus]|uniref:Uncharacterized protein n=1 Tax=Cyclotella atomus TaxID=382360 RepID=A0ABD3PPD2_9STRA